MAVLAAATLIVCAALSEPSAAGRAQRGLGSPLAHTPGVHAAERAAQQAHAAERAAERAALRAAHVPPQHAAHTPPQHARLGLARDGPQHHVPLHPRPVPHGPLSAHRAAEPGGGGSPDGSEPRARPQPGPHPLGVHHPVPRAPSAHQAIHAQAAQQAELFVHRVEPPSSQPATAAAAPPPSLPLPPPPSPLSRGARRGRGHPLAMRSTSPAPERPGGARATGGELLLCALAALLVGALAAWRVRAAAREAGQRGPSPGVSARSAFGARAQESSQLPRAPA